jgi:hypothetical protein
MTLQDFFISGLPTNETRSRTSTMTTEKQLLEQSDRLKVDRKPSRPSVSVQKPSTPKRI